jgi:STE24 endopeptidase
MTPDYSSPVLIAAVALIVLKWAAELWLDRLNERHVQRHAEKIPDALRDTMDDATYKKSVQYTLAKSQHGRFDNLFGAVLLIAVLLTGALPRLFEWVSRNFGQSAWAMSGFLIGVMLLFMLACLPLDWRAQFRLEERFGFNTTTQGTWWADRAKAVLLMIVIVLPLFALLLKLVDWTGSAWWLWGWACLTGFQFLMMILAPVLILPLFNKFSPLEDGPLKERLLALAKGADFSAQKIQIMDGSRRSKHSNAFFTGFGRARRIVLFDTLIEQLNEAELEAVLAHEIGHYKKRHIPKMLLLSAASSLLGFYVLYLLAGFEGFYDAFGFSAGYLAPAFLLFGLLSGAIEFWFSPLLNRLSRKHEYEADAYAKERVGAAQPLISALRKLNEKNLGNLTPHPAYSGFHYSHPALLEREAALNRD